MEKTKVERKGAAKPRRAATFTQPIQQIITMLLVLGLVAAGAWLIHREVAQVLASNWWLNGIIIFVFVMGIATCFWQVWILVQSVSWIENFVRSGPGQGAERAPRLLAPLAALLRGREQQTQISASSSRSILESVAQRIDEARDITRYLANLLVFLGLLGTFFGLAVSIPAIVETIRSLAPQQGESGIALFGKLMGGLESQLGGMGTAFSSSLLGLAGSLVVGLLELFAGHGQSRFYRELEEWLSSIAVIGYAGAGTGEASSEESYAVIGILEQMSGQISALQAVVAEQAEQREANSQQMSAWIAGLSEQVQAEAGQLAALNRIAEGQERLLAALSGPDSAAQQEAEARMRLRSIDLQLLKILEEISAGRQESVADVRAELSALTAAVRQLARTGLGR